ncbi:MAG: acyl-CoA synthetase [marine bacterium B5-7]|nr:MAG: acyl-CoA synthetase [marine bacterium B5-7]
MQLPKMNNYDEIKSQFKLNMPEFYNFGFDVVEKVAQEQDKTAFIAVDKKGENIQHYAFSDLDLASNRFANALLSTGAKKGDFAFVMLPRIPEWYFTMVGCCKSGVVAMPGTALLTATDIEHRINQSKAKIIIVTAEDAVKVDEIRHLCPTLKIFIVIGKSRKNWQCYSDITANASETLDKTQLEATRSTDLMIMYFTSGTTAMPKMVPRDHSYALAHSITGRYWMDLEKDDIHWTLSDTGWAKAAWGMLFSPWQMGAAVILFNGEGFDAELHLKLIGKLGVTSFCAPPTIYRVFAQMDLSQYNLTSIRHAIGAGEPLNPEVIKVWHAATGSNIYDGYGQTETINIVANYPAIPVKPGSMGKPVPGVDVQIVDDEGQLSEINTVGHIAIRITDPLPPGMFAGYWEDAKATARAFRNGWYQTGDTGTIDEDGYIWFVGRSDDVITSSGYRISPFEVESCLLEHPAVHESAAVGKPDEIRGEIVKAFIVLAPNFEPSEALTKELQDFMKKTTAPYKYPREIEYRESLPKTVSGKIRRVELREEGLS